MHCAGLNRSFPFHASCTQERLDSNLQQLVEDSYEAVTQQLAPDLQQAYAVEDEEALEGVADQVAALVEVLDAAFNKLALKQQTQLWVQVRGRTQGRVEGSQGIVSSSEGSFGPFLRVAAWHHFVKGSSIEASWLEVGY